MAQRAHDAYWRAMGQEPGWETLAQRYGGEAPAERVRGSWAAAAAACAPGEGHSIALAEERERQVTAELREAQAALEERDVSLAKLTSQLATVRADSEARIVGLEAQLREASMTAALEAQTSADLRRVNDALRAQLAEACDPAGLTARMTRAENTAAALEVQRANAEALAEERGRRVASLERMVTEAEAEATRLRAEVADVRTFANFEAEKAEDLARQLREAQHRVEWATRKDGSRALIRHRLIVEELGSVGPQNVGANARGVSYAYRVDDVTGSGIHTDSAHDIEQLLSAAQRVVEALTGVRP